VYRHCATKLVRVSHKYHVTSASIANYERLLTRSSPTVEHLHRRTTSKPTTVVSIFPGPDVVTLDPHGKTLFLCTSGMFSYQSFSPGAA
jgi:hypothetical protein